MIQKNRKTKIINAIVLFCTALTLVFAVPKTDAYAETKAEPVPEISSELAAVYTLNTHEMLVSKNSEMPSFQFDLAKLMLVLVATDKADKAADGTLKRTELVTVGNEIAALPKGYKSAGFMVGDVVALPDLISAVLMLSADDAATTIAVYIGRKVLANNDYDVRYNYDKKALLKYLELMNNKAQLMGLSSTSFHPVTSYYVTYEKTASSTAGDLAIISAEMRENKTLVEIMSKTSMNYWNVEETGKTYDNPIEKARNSVWKNNNQLINPKSSFYYEYCSGFMSITTADNKTNISVYAEHNDIKIVVVLLDTNSDTAYDDVINLCDYVFNNYVMYSYVEAGQKIAEYYVNNAMDPSNEHLKVLATGSVSYLTRIDKIDLFDSVMRLNKQYFLPTVENLYDEYIAPNAGIVKNDILGSLDIYYNTKYITTVTLYAGNTVPVFENLPELNEIKWYQKVDWPNLLLIVLVIIFLVCIFILIISIINKVKRQRYTKRRYSLYAPEKKPAAHYRKKKQH